MAGQTAAGGRLICTARCASLAPAQRRPPHAAFPASSTTIAGGAPSGCARCRSGLLGLLLRGRQDQRQGRAHRRPPRRRRRPGQGAHAERKDMGRSRSARCTCECRRPAPAMHPAAAQRGARPPPAASRRRPQAFNPRALPPDPGYQPIRTSTHLLPAHHSATPPLQIGDTLEEYLVEATRDPKLRQLMMSMSEAIRTIAYKVRRVASTAMGGASGCCNDSTGCVTSGVERTGACLCP